ncbi:MAG: 50S ribosomal protein L3 [candidate division Zixibacteria bacterium 4484_93]|nr:MAG: 50S ribosomal protein L3 [candidate division Zixibacteria bacterium 4484_93]RKZ33220.1 MAG: 50S ribosomal protein L3 [bacterium]
MIGIVGKKIGMTRIFDEDGKAIPVTVIQAKPNRITQVKTTKKDNYNAIQVGAFEIPIHKANKPMQGHLKGKKAYRLLKEFREENLKKFKVGTKLGVELFAPGDIVSCTATSKGKGFQGVVKRHSFKGLSKSHGQSNKFRSPGSLAGSSYPSRVFKGKKMAGRTGGKTTTVKNLTVVKVDKKNSLLLISGCIPGYNGAVVLVKKQSRE